MFYDPQHSPGLPGETHRCLPLCLFPIQTFTRRNSTWKCFIPRSFHFILLQGALDRGVAHSNSTAQSKGSGACSQANLEIPALLFPDTLILARQLISVNPSFLTKKSDNDSFLLGLL